MFHRLDTESCRYAWRQALTVISAKKIVRIVVYSDVGFQQNRDHVRSHWYIGAPVKNLFETTYALYKGVDRVENSALLYIKCNGIEESASRYSSTILLDKILLKFYKLGMPISLFKSLFSFITIRRWEALHGVIAGA